MVVSIADPTYSRKISESMACRRECEQDHVLTLLTFEVTYYGAVEGGMCQVCSMLISETPRSSYQPQLLIHFKCERGQAARRLR